MIIITRKVKIVMNYS